MDTDSDDDICLIGVNAHLTVHEVNILPQIQQPTIEQHLSQLTQAIELFGILCMSVIGLYLKNTSNPSNIKRLKFLNLEMNSISLQIIDYKVRYHQTSHYNTVEVVERKFNIALSYIAESMKLESSDNLRLAINQKINEIEYNANYRVYITESPLETKSCCIVM